MIIGALLFGAPVLTGAGWLAVQFLPAHHETMVHWAMTITMTRRLASRRPSLADR